MPLFFSSTYTLGGYGNGLAEWLMSDNERARDLRRAARITIIPIMDVDSVQSGRGGKDQKPHDHNRDWIDHPHWNAVKAAMAHPGFVLRYLGITSNLHWKTRLTASM